MGSMALLVVRGQRAASAQTPAGLQVLLYGGSDPDGPLADAWVLNMAQGTLTKLANSEKAKAWHSAQYLTTDNGRYVVVYGGEAVANLEGVDEVTHASGGGGTA